MRQGYVEWVDSWPARSVLAEDALADQDVLVVQDGTPFSTADQVLVEGVPYDVAAVALGTGEDSPSTIVLASPLPALVEIGQPVEVYPAVMTTWAGISRAEELDVITVRIPQSPQLTLPSGPRATPAEREVVTYAEGEHGLEIVSIEGKAEIVPGLVPPSPPPAPVQPSESPAPSVVGTLRQIVARVPGVENDTPVEYEWHVATSNAAAPSAATLSVQTSSTGVALTNLADGTPLAYDTDYYVATVAESGGLQAPPSPWVLVRLNRAGTADIAAGAVTATQLSAIITVSSLFRTAETGQRVEFDNAGIRVYNSAGVLVVKLTYAEVVILADRLYAKFLETAGARLGGTTYGPPDGVLDLGAATLPAPGSALTHESVPLERVALAAGAGGPVFSDDTYRWQIVNAGGASMWTFRRINADGTLSTTVTRQVVCDSISSAAFNDAAVYMITEDEDFGQQVHRRTRAGIISNGLGADCLTPAAPGTGGYAAGDPVVGTQRGSTDILLAHRVQGAQTIDGLAYGDGEVMVRRFTVTDPGSGTALALTLNKTIRTALYAPTGIKSVIMDTASAAFDTTPVAGNTGLLLGSVGGFDPFGLNNFVLNVPNSGSHVSTAFGQGAFAWYDDNAISTFYANGAFWTTEPTGDVVRKYGTGAFSGNDVWHGYTYWNGTQETMLAPITKSRVFARHRSQWVIPQAPVGTTQVRLYMASADTRLRYERVGTYGVTAGAPTQITGTPITPPAGNATNPPPATSNYPGGAAYKVQTSNSDTAVYGDGRITARDPQAPNEVVNQRSLTAAIAAAAVADTGWVNITLAAGYAEQSGTGAVQPQVRRIGNLVYTRGLVKPTSGSFAAAATVTIGTLDAQFRPTQNLYYPAVTNAAAPNARYTPLANGALQVNPAAAATYVSLAGSWPV